MIDKIKKLLTGDDTPTSAAVKEAAEEVGENLAKARDELEKLEYSREDILVLGDEQEIAKHDERVRALETRVESLEARRKALMHRRKNLEAEEAISAIPTLIEAVATAVDAVQTSEATYQSAVRDLENAVARLSAAKATVSMHRPNAVADLPAMPEELARRIREMHRPSVRVMRS